MVIIVVLQDCFFILLIVYIFMSFYIKGGQSNYVKESFLVIMEMMDIMEINVSRIRMLILQGLKICLVCCLCLVQMNIVVLGKQSRVVSMRVFVFVVMMSQMLYKVVIVVIMVLCICCDWGLFLQVLFLIIIFRVNVVDSRYGIRMRVVVRVVIVK